MSSKAVWLVPWLLLLCAPVGRAAVPDSASDSSTAAPAQNLQDLQRQINAALAELSARLDSARSRQAQATVDGVLYLRWSDDVAQSPGRNQFEVDRAYINVHGPLSCRALYRVTLDAARITNERLFDFLKYAYGGVTLGPAATVALGLQQTPLLDFQERVWKFRFVQKMLSDFEGKLTASDLGLGAEGALASPVAYKVLVANGEGYTRPEQDRQKDLEGRLTFTLAPGLRLSTYAHYGLVDTSRVRAPSQVRHRYDAFLSLEQPRYTAFAEALGAEDQSEVGGRRVQSGGVSLCGFLEFAPDWRAFARLDSFDPDRQRADDAHLHGMAGLSYSWGHNLMVALSDQWLTYGAAAAARNVNQVFLNTQVTF